jgi:sugar lactone lactonase YvrE
MLVGMVANAQNIFTVAGIPYDHRDQVDSQPALNASLGSVYGLLIDNATGRLIFNDEDLVLRLEPDGSLVTVAGSGSFKIPPLGAGLFPGTSLASILPIGVLRGMAQDAAGALYLSDAGYGRVYRVGTDGTVTTFAGGGTTQPGFQSDGGLATLAVVSSPRGLVFDSKGNLDIAEVFCSCIRRVTPDGIISTVYSLPPIPPGMRLPNIEGLAIDAQDNLYFTEWFGNVVVKVPADGSPATTIAGTGAPGFSGDGGPAANALLNGPSGITVDAGGNLYIADSKNNRVRMITPDGKITTIAGNGSCGFLGNNGPALRAQLCQPAETVLDASGNLLITDYGNRRVRSLAPNGTLTTIAGGGQSDPAFITTVSNPAGQAEIRASFSLLGGTAFDSAGNLYASDSFGNVILKIAPNGAVSTFAGTGQQGYSGDGGPATQAELFHPGPILVGPDGSLYLITGDSRVRKITPDGIIHLVAGTGTGTGLNRASGDGGPAIDATLNEPGGLAFDKQGNLYIADTSNARVRKVDADGTITTVAGPGQEGMDYYNAVAVDPQGNLYVAWTRLSPPSIEATVNRVNADGSFTRVAGSGTPCTNGPGQFTGDGVPAAQARLCAVVGLTVDPNGQLTLSEGGYSLMLRIAADGTIQRLAGNTAAMYVGDGGPALQASLMGGQGFSPGPASFDLAGNLYLAEPGLNIIREVTNTPYTPHVSPDHFNAVGPTVQRQTLTVSANFAEPFPYAVRVSTANGGSWLSANRVTGLTGESITVSVNPAGLGKGSYEGTVAVLIYAPVQGPAIELDVPVSLTVP